MQALRLHYLFQGDGESMRSIKIQRHTLILSILLTTVIPNLANSSLTCESLFSESSQTVRSEKSDGSEGTLSLSLPIDIFNFYYSIARKFRWDVTPENITAAQIASSLRTRNSRFQEQCIALERSKTPTENDYRALLRAHVQEATKNFDNDVELRSAQNIALAEDLARHGLALSSRDGKNELKRISAGNLRRILDSLRINWEYRNDSEIRALISKVEIKFVHNGSSHSKLGSYILSSRRIQSLGLEGGLNSFSTFSREFLNNDNSVFFSVQFVRKGEKIIKPSSYGSHEHVPDPGYSEEVGWISPYVMYKHDLEEFGHTLLSKNFPHEKNYVDQQENLRNQLHQFDFTVSDFRMLIEAQMGNFLLNLKQTDNQKLQHVASILHGHGTTDDMNRVIAMLIAEPIGFRNENAWEFKIPIAVPTKHIKD